MFIDQAKQIEKYTSHNIEFGKTSPAEVGSAEGVFAFEKTKESYRMTEQGSFFMPDAVYQKPAGKEEETVVDQLTTRWI